MNEGPDTTTMALKPMAEGLIHHPHAYELTIDELVAQSKKIDAALKAVMTEGIHYGVIPGTPKPTLLQPGAEKLMLLFRLDPQFESGEERDGPHLTIKSTCTLYHIPTGLRRGSGQGSCSTRESRYAYRRPRRLCPSCQQESIIKGKAEYGGGWVCFKKQGGCGAKFPDGDAQIEAQVTGRVPNEDLADQYNTVLKMANKRAKVAAVLNVTAASDIFTEDLEDGAPSVSAPPADGQGRAHPAGTYPPGVYRIREVRLTEGVSKGTTEKPGRPYTLYHVIVHTGEALATFDAEVAAAARRAQEAEGLVEIMTEAKRFGPQIVTLQEWGDEDTIPF